MDEDQVLVEFYRYIRVFGGNSEKDTPVPIPNTEVKLFSADGTAWATVWESRSPPGFIFKAFIFIDESLFFLLLWCKFCAVSYFFW